MSTYHHQVILNDSESIMLQMALENMIALCDEKLKNGHISPYQKHKHSAEALLGRLYQNMVQTSGNNFFRRNKKE